MTSARLLSSMVAALAILAGACSSSSSSSSGTGGVTGSGGTAAGGARSGTGGANGTGGASVQGGTTGSGGTTQAGSGGQSGTGGRTVPASGGVATGGQVGTGGVGAGGASTSTGGRPGTGGSGALGGATALGGTAGSGSGGATSLGTGGATSLGTGGATNLGTGGGTSLGTGGSAGSSGTDTGAVPSTGCGKTRTLQNGTITITYSGASRKHILKVPDGYDSNHPYRLVLAYTWSGGTAAQVVSANYFTFATQDSKNTIFSAPDAANGSGSWSSTDVGFTDAILTQLEGDLCIDKSRVFATGFSFGGGMAMALACTRADVFRAVAFFSGADLTGSCPTTLTKPIAYYASQASEDANGLSPTDPMTGEMKQAQFAAVNGCTAVPSSTTYPTSGQPHTCTIYKGCSAGHPTEYCVFNGPHGWEPKDPGQSTSWDAPEAWKFITQF